MIALILFPFFIFTSFFILYSLSKHDFVLVRKNISLAQVFDLSIVTFLIAFVAGRLVFILDYLQFELFNPIRFFHFLRLPGFSYLGFFVGGLIALFFLFRKKKALSRTYDIFTLSFFPVYIFNLLFRKYPINFFIIPIVLGILAIILFAYLLKSHNTYRLRDGNISYIFLIVLSLDHLIIDFFVSEKAKYFFLSLSQYFSLIVLILALVFIAGRTIFRKK